MLCYTIDIMFIIYYILEGDEVAFLNKQDKTDILMTPISNIFIDKYMPKANAIFVKVYLYGYRNCYHGIYDLTSKQIADAMDILESDVILSWKYWEQNELMKLHYNDETSSYDVEYLTIKEEIEKIEDNKINYNIIATRPQYSPQELDIYRNTSKEINDLFDYSRKTLNKMITYNDLNVLFSFYDWLRLPIDVIKALLAYYSNKSMKYIEKVAIEWAENEIDTLDKVEERMKLFGEYRAIIRAFGLGTRLPIDNEEEYMKKWLKTYMFPTNIIIEACKKTVLQIGKVNFKYADQILTNWYKNNVKTIDDISKLEEAFTQKKKLEAEKRLPNNSNNYQIPKQNRFANYEQRKWDFEELEKLEREYIDKRLGR